MPGYHHLVPRSSNYYYSNIKSFDPTSFHPHALPPRGPLWPFIVPCPPDHVSDRRGIRRYLSRPTSSSSAVPFWTRFVKQRILPQSTTGERTAIARPSLASQHISLLLDSHNGEQEPVPRTPIAEILLVRRKDPISSSNQVPTDHQVAYPLSSTPLPVSSPLPSHTARPSQDISHLPHPQAH